MTPSLPSKPAILTVSFDVDQISAILAFKLERANLTDIPPPPQPVKGLFANSLYFERDEEVRLVIVAGGADDKDKSKAKGKFRSFKIVDACMTTLPRIVNSTQLPPTIYVSAPSPFQDVRSANYHFGHDFHETSDIYSPEEKYRRVTNEYRKKLRTIKGIGKWEISVVLTVEIERHDSDKKDIRVFWFDPESEVGSSSTIKIEERDED